VALTFAQKVAIIKHYEDSGPMRITTLIDWVMEKFGDNIKKPPSHASMSILLNKQKNGVLLLHNTAMNERVMKGKRARSSNNEARVHSNFVFFSHCMLMLMRMTIFVVLAIVFIVVACARL
jgi:hypothetical protein